MDESWRKRMGMGSCKSSISDTESDPVDFNDVFGGSPRSAMERKYSADNMSTSDSFYHEVFQAAKHVNSEILDGQRLPGFLIPEQRRYKTKVMKSAAMSKSKSTSSSVLSFDEFGPDRSIGMATEHEDLGFMNHTTKLRPLNMPYRWTSTSPSPLTSTTQRTAKCKNKKQDYDNQQVKNFIFGFPHNTIPTPESAHFDPDLVKRKLVADYHLPPSCHSPSSTVMSSSYVIEMNSPTVEDANNSDDIDIDDAIAWAKEKFQG